jgi:hypothetical protein
MEELAVPKKPKQAKKPKVRPELPPDLTRLRMVSIREAAELRGVSVDGFKRHFSHLIQRVSPRRLAVRVGDLLNEPTSQPNRRASEEVA